MDIESHTNLSRTLRISWQLGVIFLPLPYQQTGVDNHM
jgi:hypothetical protein